jgi:hypothetical protein
MAGKTNKPEKNLWMENGILLAAAVKAVEKNHPLRWDTDYRSGNFSSRNTWNDYKRAAAWVYRERKKRAILKPAQSHPPTAPVGITTAGRRAGPAVNGTLTGDSASHVTGTHGTKSPQFRIAERIKEVLIQFGVLFALIPLGFIFGFNYKGGLVGTFSAFALVLGLLILVFRYIRALSASFHKEKPLAKHGEK